MNFDPKRFLEDYTKDLLDTKKPLNPLDRKAYMEGHIRLLELAMVAERVDEQHKTFDKCDHYCDSCYEERVIELERVPQPLHKESGL